MIHQHLTISINNNQYINRSTNQLILNSMNNNSYVNNGAVTIARRSALTGIMISKSTKKNAHEIAKNVTLILLWFVYGLHRYNSMNSSNKHKKAKHACTYFTASDFSLLTSNIAITFIIHLKLIAVCLRGDINVLCSDRSTGEILKSANFAKKHNLAIKTTVITTAATMMCAYVDCKLPLKILEIGNQVHESRRFSENSRYTTQ